MTDETFEEYKICLINKCLEKLKNLGQEALCFWNHIISKVFDFEQEQEIIVVNEYKASVSSMKIPVKIEDIKV
ncbi:a-pheromone processing metallopeptidase Ste23 protein [Rutstroemia sp. NJR-2017a WRK4]|nr:a-pheromone processing metallopeptidase Ste23 protein [Rutstroemia sp. NJR-2017a WRK4]